MSAAPEPPLRPRGPRRAVVVAALALACLPYVLGLGAPPLWDANEPLYAEPPREGLATGDWLAPPWNGRPWFVRPPLSSWATMLGYLVLGVGEAGARVAGALAAVATVAAVAGLGAALGGRRTALVAGLVAAATPRAWLFSRQLPGDTWLTLALVAGFLGAAPTLRGDPAGRRRLLLGHAAVAVGVLAKGPVILGLYAVPLVLAARWGRPRVPLAALRPGALVALVVVLAGPWFAYMTARYGVPYLRDFFGWHHVRRAVSDDVGGRGALYPLLVFLGEGQPFVLLAPFALAGAVRAGRRDPLTVLAWAGALFPLVFFSIPVGKRSVYLLPGYPLLAVALAPTLEALVDGRHPRLARAAGLVAAAAAVAGTGFLVAARAHVPPALATAALPFLVGTPVAGAVAAVAALRRSGRGVVAVLVAAPWAGILAATALLPALGRYMPVPALARTLVEVARPGEPAVVYGVSIHSLMFYARRPTVTARNPAELLAAVPPGGRALVLGQADEVAILPAHVPVRMTELSRGPWFRFQFKHNVLGQGPSVEDLVLVAVERAGPGVPPPGGAAGAGVPATSGPGEAPAGPVR